MIYVSHHFLFLQDHNKVQVPIQPSLNDIADVLIGIYNVYFS